MSRIKAWGLAVVASVAIGASFAAILHYGARRADTDATARVASDANDGTAIPAGPIGVVRADASSGRVAKGAERGTFIVVFEEAPLATYRGGVAGIPAPGRDRAAKNGSLRLDTRGPSARAYVDYLRKRQETMTTQMSSMTGRTLRMRSTMQHAMNAVVVDLDRAEAEAIRALSGVSFVEEYAEHEVDTDRGPQLIGAEPVWNGSNPGANGTRYRGEGMVVAVLDTGINFGSPSFAAVGPVDGYAHVNPLGANNYLGTCAAGGIDVGRCNAKLIGGFDFVCGAPGNQCGATDVREEEGFGDSEGHGSHVASTAAGNVRDAFYGGANRRISGVAPHANIIAYDICYFDIAGGTGRCPNVSAVAAVDSLVATGIVDAVNYSIGGGAAPWTDAVSLAFLNAVEAGVYVSASAGNSGPGADTVSHLQPWVASNAAVQHGRAGYAIRLTVTGPAPVPSTLTAIVATEGSGGTPHNGPIPGNTPLKISSGIDTADDGCASYPPGTFVGAIAVIRRGTCAFSTKAGNASAAGAIAVIIANNVAGGLSPSVPGAPVAVFAVSQTNGDALRDFAVPRPSATASIGFPSEPLANTPDVIASFSSRGPADTLNVLKPDFAAPGVSVLAVDAGTTITGFEGLVGLKSGTSMASPHHTGAVALLRQARPSWSVPEVKSAFALTAYDQVLATNETSPATPFDTGSGRIRVDRAINAGLVMHETGANYRAANPVSGDAAQLNQPNLVDGRCGRTCSFIRTFRNPHAVASTWNLQLQGVTGTVPASITVPAGASVSVTITLSPPVATGAWSFGSLTLTAVGSSSTPLRLPIAVVGSSARPRNDFDGDGKSDMGWWNAAGGYFSYWKMDGFNFVSANNYFFGIGQEPTSTGRPSGNVPSEILMRRTSDKSLTWFRPSASGQIPFPLGNYADPWVIVGQGDVDGDSKDDLFWRNSVTGAFAYWRMDGSTFLGAQTYATTTAFNIAAISDFNGDGKADILWDAPSGPSMSVWLSVGAGFDVKQIGAYSTEWRVLGAGDVDGDGNADILWRNSSNTYLAYWRMNGGTFLASNATPTPTDITFQTTGDYNGDGLIDIIWTRNSDQQVQMWLGNGVNFGGYIIGASSTAWALVK